LKTDTDQSIIDDLNTLNLWDWNTIL
jgi:hypothetical protein